MEPQTPPPIEEEKKEAFLMSDDLWKAYSERVLKTSYHLSCKELELAANLYNKKVILFSEVQDLQVLNPNGAECVAIKHSGNHKGGHYSRLHPTEIVEVKDQKEAKEP